MKGSEVKGHDPSPHPTSFQALEQSLDGNQEREDPAPVDGALIDQVLYVFTFQYSMMFQSSAQMEKVLSFSFEIVMANL